MRAEPYLRLSNYVRNWLRHGYDLVPHGSPETVAAGLARHHEADADHVAIQVLPVADDGIMPGLRALAGAIMGR